MAESATSASEQQHAQSATEDKVEKGKGRVSDDSGMDEDEEEDDDYEEVRADYTWCNDNY